ncbi:MAG: hypothetical protein IJU50_09160, partial [Lachnospiraceae bacterium]|nr:hypothetical protein [Lachnospiraceae bacterium]
MKKRKWRSALLSAPLCTVLALGGAPTAAFAAETPFEEGAEKAVLTENAEGNDSEAVFQEDEVLEEADVIVSGDGFEKSQIVAENEEALEESESEEAFGDGEETPAADSLYVLMNIPYGDFYKAELGGNDAVVDAVSSATKNKPRTGTLAGGSYHVNKDGSDISGVVYPVFVADKTLLEGLTQVTDDTSVSITVTNRGKETTTEYKGKDALFESASYSYYLLSEKPERYKTLTKEEGVLSFGAVSGRTTTIEGASGTVTFGARHADIEIVLEGLSKTEGEETIGIAQGDEVSGVVLTDSDGTKYGLRHIVNLWRGTQIGWNSDEPMNKMRGKKITDITYYTNTAVYDYPVSISLDDSLSKLEELKTALDVLETSAKEEKDAFVNKVKSRLEEMSAESYDSSAITEAMADGSALESIQEVETAYLNALKVSYRGARLSGTDLWIQDEDSVEVIGAGMNAVEGDKSLRVIIKANEVGNYSGYAASVGFSLSVYTAKRGTLEKIAHPVWVKVPVPEGLKDAKQIRLLGGMDETGAFTSETVSISGSGEDAYISFVITKPGAYALAKASLTLMPEAAVISEIGGAVEIKAVSGVSLDSELTWKIFSGESIVEIA